MFTVLSFMSFGMLAGGPLLGLGAVVLGVMLALQGAWGPALVTAVGGVVLGTLLHFLGLVGAFTVYTGSEGWRRLRAARVRPALTWGLALWLGASVAVIAAAFAVGVGGTVRSFVLSAAGDAWPAAWTALGALGGAVVIFMIGMSACSYVGETLDARAKRLERSPEKGTDPTPAPADPG